MAIERANLIDDALAQYLDERPTQNENVQFAPVEDVSIFKCPRCDSNMVVRTKKQGKGKYISCMGYPECKNAIWLSEAVEDVEVLNETCNQVNTFSYRSIFQSHITYILYMRTNTHTHTHT